MNFIMKKFLAGDSAWDNLDKSLSQVGEEAKGFVILCQKYWWIPVLIGVVLVAGMILIGGRQGRVQAKSTLGIIILSVGVLFSALSIVAVIVGIFGGSAPGSLTS